MTTTKRFDRLSVLSLLCGAGVFALIRGVIAKRLETPDEGVNATMGLNMCRSVDFLIHPSYLPLGTYEWSTGDLSGIANTPFHSALLAALGCPFGGSVHAMAMVSFASLVATVLFTYATVALWDRRAGLIAAALLACSPSVLASFRLLEMEPLMTAWGMAGIYAIARGERDGRRLLTALGGAFVGLGFLAKLWLVVPFVLAAGALLLAVRVRDRAVRLGPVLLASVGFLVAASAHLGFVALTSPGDLRAWLRGIYFAAFLGESIGGSKLSGAGIPPEWVHPSWYYGAILYREHFALFPLLIAGLPALGRRARGWAAPLAAIGGAALGLVLLSAPPVKEPLYILSTTPFLYALAGLAVSAFLEPPQGEAEERSDRLATRAAGAFAVLTTLAIAAAFMKGLKRDDVTGPFVMAHTAGMLGAFGLVLAARRLALGRFVRLSVATLAVWLGAFAVHEARAEALPYQEIADVVRPYVAGAAPQRESFVAPLYKILQLYLFRNGRYWESHFTQLDANALKSSLASGQLCAFVTGPKERDDARVQEVVRTLEASTTELTSQLPPRHRADYRVFVNPACKRD